MHSSETMHVEQVVANRIEQTLDGFQKGSKVGLLFQFLLLKVAAGKQNGD